EYYQHGKLHRDNDKPAVIKYKHNNELIKIEYYKNGKQYTPEIRKPFIVEHHSNGNISYELYLEPTKWEDHYIFTILTYHSNSKLRTKEEYISYDIPFIADYKYPVKQESYNE